MHLHPLLLFSFGLIGATGGRILFGRWFNHVSLYSLIWGTGLMLFELGWIKYYPMTADAWLMIGYAWVAFSFGSAIVILARRSVADSSNPRPSMAAYQTAILERRYLKIVVAILCCVAFLGVLQHWMVLLDRFGSIVGILLNGGTIYSLRTSGQLTGMVPYVDSLALTGACLAGIYCARAGGIKPLGILPLLIIMLDEVAIAARAKLLVAGLLFLSAYFLAKVAPASSFRSRHLSRIRRLLPMIVVLAVLVLGAEFVRGIRETSFRYYGLTSKFEKYPFVSPSLYLYFTCHPGAFNAYLKAEKEDPFPGTYTFAPLFRVFARLGIADAAPLYQEFYNTPIPANTGTYLRDIHAEFGIVGVLVMPYVLGLICTMLWIRIREGRRLILVVWLSHLYVVVAFTYIAQGTQLGFWLLSLLASLFIAYAVERRSAIATGVQGGWRSGLLRADNA